MEILPLIRGSSTVAEKGNFFTEEATHRTLNQKQEDIVGGEEERGSDPVWHLFEIVELRVEAGMRKGRPATLICKLFMKKGELQGKVTLRSLRGVLRGGDRHKKVTATSGRKKAGKGGGDRGKGIPAGLMSSWAEGGFIRRVRRGRRKRSSESCWERRKKPLERSDPRPATVVPNGGRSARMTPASGGTSCTFTRGISQLGGGKGGPKLGPLLGGPDGERLGRKRWVIPYVFRIEKWKAGQGHAASHNT